MPMLSKILRHSTLSTTANVYSRLTPRPPAARSTPSPASSTPPNATTTPASPIRPTTWKDLSRRRVTTPTPAAWTAVHDHTATTIRKRPPRLAAEAASQLQKQLSGRQDLNLQPPDPQNRPHGRRSPAGDHAPAKPALRGGRAESTPESPPATWGSQSARPTKDCGCPFFIRPGQATLWYSSAPNHPHEDPRQSDQRIRRRVITPAQRPSRHIEPHSPPDGRTTSRTRAPDPGSAGV